MGICYFNIASFVMSDIIFVIIILVFFVIMITIIFVIIFVIVRPYHQITYW